MLDDTTVNAIIAALEMRQRAELPERGKQAIDRALAQMKSIQRGDEIIICWGIDDIKSLGEDYEGNTTIEITDTVARAALAKAKEYHDASVGINWEVLQIHLDDALEDAREAAENPNGGDGEDD